MIQIQEKKTKNTEHWICQNKVDPDFGIVYKQPFVLNEILFLISGSYQI